MSLRGSTKAARAAVSARRRDYQERVKAQTFQWARGFPYHNRIDDECCPDFSCCKPEMFEADAAKRWEHYRNTCGAN
jgi:hypothetical protein